MIIPNYVVLKDLDNILNKLSKKIIRRVVTIMN